MDTNNAWTEAEVTEWKAFDDRTKYVLDHVSWAHPSWDGNAVIAQQWEEFRNLFPDASARELLESAQFAEEQCRRQADWLRHFVNAATAVPWMDPLQ